MVFSGLVIAWRLATCPTSRSPVLVKATTDGVVRPPSSLAMTLGSPPSITATQELVVPRSIPIILAMLLSFVSMLPRPALGYGRWRQALIFHRRPTPRANRSFPKYFGINELTVKLRFIM